MELYNSEQEQVEALKAWWDKNGKSVIAAIVVVLMAVLGWKTWMGHQQQRAATASAGYQKMMDALASNPDAAMEAGRQIVGEHPDSVYAAMASLAMGRIAVEKGELDAAAAHLKAVPKQTDQKELVLLSHLRLSQILLAQGKTDEALAQLEGDDAGLMQAEFSEQRGDILMAKGDKAGARDAYTNALTGYSEVPAKRELVQLKLNDLAESKSE